MINTKGFALPKPQHKKRQPQEPVTKKRDGREVCNLNTAEGMREYRRRILIMLARQKGLCCICKKPLAEGRATFEHEAGRGMNSGHREDRVEIDGKWTNGASCVTCNFRKGSRRGTYNA